MTPVGDLTDFPMLFGRASYWSSFKIEQNPNITNEIIQNRNKFAVDYKLKITTKNIPEHGTELDHAELYYTEDKKYVLVCSKYNDEPPPQSLNMKIYLPLYSTSCITYIGVYNSVTDFNHTMKTFKTI